ncbi:MAG: hypothetical protein FWE21_08885 [Defluviitaleaceae bacterium]|nr:hypothetical protein [Defluviitaleaceae bacterium]
MLDTQLSTLFSGALFRKVLSNEQLTIIEYNFLLGALVGNNIPFESAFVSGTRKSPASFQLTIHINPSVTLVLVVSLEPGSSVYSPSP